jgi:hypothetical protein
MASEDNIVGFAYTLFANIFNELRAPPPLDGNDNDDDDVDSDGAKASAARAIPLAARRWRASRALDEVCIARYLCFVLLFVCLRNGLCC